MVNIRCHKCRKVLVEIADLLNAHGHVPEKTTEDPDCFSLEDRTLIFVKDENLPVWINEKIEAESWMKGKLHCEGCGCKIGSFDYVSGRKCECGESVLPCVHFIRSQVDVTIGS